MRLAGVCMNIQRIKKVRFLVPFLLLTFLVCGSGGLFCPMAESAAGTPHGQAHSHQVPSTPFHPSEDCLDQFKSSEEQSRDLPYGVLPVAEGSQFAIIVDTSFSYYLLTRSAPRSSSYPLLFLLFSAILN